MLNEKSIPDKLYELLIENPDDTIISIYATFLKHNLVTTWDVLYIQKEYKLFTQRHKL